MAKKKVTVATSAVNAALKEKQSDVDNEGDDTEFLNTFSPEPMLSPQRVAIVGAILIAFGMIGFLILPGLISDEASGSRLVNAFYCSVITLTTIGFGDVCPFQPDAFGEIFLSVLALSGIGFFCGPLLQLASFWKSQVPGGLSTLATVTFAIGVSTFTIFEGLSYSKAVHLSVVTGTTIGYGNITPKTDLGKICTAVYAILICNVMGGLLEPARKYLESFCHVKSNKKEAKKRSR